MNYPDIFLTPEYQLLFSKTAFGGAMGYFKSDGVEYRFYRRSVEGTPYRDVISPYGYSGPVAIGKDANWASFLAYFHDYCKQENIVTEFARLHPFLGNHQYLAPIKEEHNIIYLDLTQSIDSIKRGMNKSNKSLMNGHSKLDVYISPKNSTLSWFAKIYQQTMVRDKANPAYLFDARFFNYASECLGEHLIAFEAWAQSVLVGGSLFLCYGDFIHYWFSGTIDHTANWGVSHDILCEVIKWAKAEGYKVMNLGGGLKGGDSLEGFKCTFSPLVKPFYTYRKIHNWEAYMELCKGIDLNSEGFFPAYRR